MCGICGISAAMTDKWMPSNVRRVCSILFVICLVLVAVQYRFNYFSISYCSKNDRFVKRVVERVYYELPTKKGHSTLPKLNQEPTTDPSIVGKVVNNFQTCKPIEYVVFLKTHKTGSSTITNILNRYADKNNKSVLLPKDLGYYSFDWPNKFRLSSAAYTFQRPNFLANHARYSRKSMEHLFPHDTTTFISVLRHPVSQWESTFQYMSFPYILDIADKTDPLHFFLEHPPSTENIKDIARRYPSLYLIRNALFYDLGLDYQYFENSTFIRRAIHTLNKDFNLVLIMEHFDESLTLLRRRLCWDIDDVVYFKMNERLNKHKRRVLTTSQIQKIKMWNKADMALYNFFVERFWNEVKNEGPGFHDDVVELRKRKLHYSKICIEREAIEEAYSTVFVKGYKMRTNLTGSTKTFCERMLKNELRYMDYFRAKRNKWTRSLEGETIENFNDSVDEADIFIEESNIQISEYLYGTRRLKKKMKKKFNGLHSLGTETNARQLAEKRQLESYNLLSYTKNFTNLKTVNPMQNVSRRKVHKVVRTNSTAPSFIGA